MSQSRPLQTHGIYEDVWSPPKSNSPYCTYDRRDESWMRPLGLGTVRSELAPMFDVRDEEGKLVGYLDHSPQWSQNRNALRIAIAPDRMRGDTWKYATLPIGRVVFSGIEFCYFVANKNALSLLVQNRGFTLSTEDQIKRFAQTLERSMIRTYWDPLPHCMDYRGIIQSTRTY